MSILIKGMEMPKDCPMCPMAHWNGYGEFTGCEIVAGKKYADKTDPEYMKSTSRPGWCPLVHVPAHGRLIDADEFFKALTMDDRVSILEAMYVQSILSETPTVIPAEEAPP